MGIMLIDSAPPATTTRSVPVRMRMSAWAMASRPEAQRRFTVTPGTPTGNPARNAANRAMLNPASPSGCAQPRITSSISDLSRAGTRSKAPPNAVAARSSGRVVARAPLGARPTGVRTALTMTASGIGNTPAAFWHWMSGVSSRFHLRSWLILSCPGADWQIGAPPGGSGHSSPLSRPRSMRAEYKCDRPCHDRQRNRLRRRDRAGVACAAWCFAPGARLPARLDRWPS